MLSPEERASQVALQALTQLAGDPGHQGTPMLNETAAAQAQSLYGAPVGASPSWTDHLGDFSQMLGNRPHPTAPFPGGFPTQRRRELDESARQFNENMALQRAVMSAQEAAASIPEPNVRSEVFNYIKDLVRDTVDRGYGFDFVEKALLNRYGDFPEEFSYEEALSSAWDLFDRVKYDAPYIQDPKDLRTFWEKNQWIRDIGGAMVNPIADLLGAEGVRTGPVEPYYQYFEEDPHMLRERFFRDRYGDW